MPTFSQARRWRARLEQMARQSHSAGKVPLLVATLGVVYGDIGTSPLYAFRQCFDGEHPLEPTPDNVLGVLSLVVWALVLVVSVKYVVFLMRVDNRGEGGIFALLALLGTRGSRSKIVLVGVFGAALLYGDGMITPAISVLSAVEGLSVITHAFEPWVVAVTVTILILLFAVQPLGIGKVASVFGPVMLLWFVVIAVLGIASIATRPEVLLAVDPRHAASFFSRNGWYGFLVLGAVVLVVTGGEALYADMGQFGRGSIRKTWFGLVLPALVVNYMGQGALLLRHGDASADLFYELAPRWALVPLVVLATTATVIASQALISAAFSMTQQAILLGLAPRLKVVHTSSKEMGQIYMPFVNWVLMVACVGLVLAFRSSTRLADAYGVAVTGTMVTSSLLYYAYLRRRLHWSHGRAMALCGAIIAIDAAFLVANLTKLPTGGWFPLVVGLFLVVLLVTWKDGTTLVSKRLKGTHTPLETFLDGLEDDPPARVPGTAVFLSASRHGTPETLLHNLRHNHVLHERNVILTLETEEVPWVTPTERVVLEEHPTGFLRVQGRMGFRERPNVPLVLDEARRHGFEWELESTTFFLGRETLLTGQPVEMAMWRQKLFVMMTLNARNAGDYLKLPASRTIELGGRLEL